MAEAHRIASAAQYVRDVGARLGTGNPGHDLTGPLAEYLDLVSRSVGELERIGYNSGTTTTPQMDALVEAIEMAGRNT